MQALAIAGGIASTIMQVQALQYQSAVAGVNAQQMRFNAQAASEAAGKDVEDIGKQTAGEAGSIEANQAASGLDMSSPSFVSGLGSFLGRGYETGVRRRSEGNQQNAAYRTQANVYDSDAKAAKGAILPTIIGGIASTASAFAQAGGKNLFATAQPTAANASMTSGPAPLGNIGLIPTPRLRPRLYSPVTSGRGR